MATETTVLEKLLMLMAKIKYLYFSSTKKAQWFPASLRPCCPQLIFGAFYNFRRPTGE